MAKIAIIGSGIGGLSLAVRLKALGHEIDVFEKNAYPGGKLNEKLISSNPSRTYRFDRGPSLFTMPENIEELFLLSNNPIKPYFSYIPLEILCSYFWEDGTKIKAHRNKEKFIKELQSTLGENRDTIEKYLKKNKKNLELTSPVFLEQSLHVASNYFNIKTLKAILRIPNLNLFTSMNRVNAETFSNPKTVQFFNRFATYNGSNPYKAPGLLNVISALEIEKGAYYPTGGMYSITKSIFDLGKHMGINYHFNSAVDEVIIEENKVKGVKINGFSTSHEIVVSNADIHHTYKKLMKNKFSNEKVLNREKSSSAIIFYWGIKKSFNELGLHNIFFTHNYKEEFESIFEKRKLYSDPTIYLNITSKYSTEDAPENCENWFVMINTPNYDGYDSKAMVEEARMVILEKLKRNLKIDIEKLIEVEEVLSPQTIEMETSSYKGSLYGNASNGRNEAFFRQANFHNKIKGLYFCGGSVHPGGGIPLAMLSAKITSELIKKREC